jgi:accessory gene regulator B
MSYSRLSTSISDYLVRELKYPEEKKDIISYSLDTLFLLISGYVLILLLGYMIGIPGAVLCSLLSGDILRKFSGGSHLSNPYRCLAATTIIYISVSWLSVQAHSIWGNKDEFIIALIVLCMTSIIIIYKYAPVDSPAKPIVSTTFRKKLKIASLATVVFLSFLALFFNSSYIGASITAGIFAQSVTLLPFLNRK